MVESRLQKQQTINSEDEKEKSDLTKKLVDEKHPELRQSMRRRPKASRPVIKPAEEIQVGISAFKAPSSKASVSPGSIPPLGSAPVPDGSELLVNRSNSLVQSQSQLLKPSEWNPWANVEDPSPQPNQYQMNNTITKSYTTEILQPNPVPLKSEILQPSQTQVVIFDFYKKKEQEFCN